MEGFRQIFIVILGTLWGKLGGFEGNLGGIWGKCGGGGLERRYFRSKGCYFTLKNAILY